MSRLLAVFARHAARVWTTAPLAAADKVALWRSGHWEIALIHHRTPR